MIPFIEDMALAYQGRSLTAVPERRPLRSLQRPRPRVLVPFRTPSYTRHHARFPVGARRRAAVPQKELTPERLATLMGNPRAKGYCHFKQRALQASRINASRAETAWTCRVNHKVNTCTSWYRRYRMSALPNAH